MIPLRTNKGSSLELESMTSQKHEIRLINILYKLFTFAFSRESTWYIKTKSLELGLNQTINGTTPLNFSNV